jgi:GTPase SAR1 family protein
MYDITSRDSYSSLVGWLESIEEHGSSNICVAIVGHKVDLEEGRAVTTDEGKKVGVGGLLGNMYMESLSLSLSLSLSVESLEIGNSGVPLILNDLVNSH